MAYVSYYDDFTGITHYENFFAIKIQELDPVTDEIDTQCFIVYDKEDDKFYVYGSRNFAKGQYNCAYQKSFSYINDMFAFLEVVMNLKLHKVNIIIYHISYATSAADFHSLNQLCSFKNEIAGYNKISINRCKYFSKYLSTIIE